MDTVMRFGDFLCDVGTTVGYYPKISRLVGLKASILLSQLVYWTGKQSNPEGWIYKSGEELEEETGLTIYEQRQARGKLKAKGILEENYERLLHRMNYRINLNALSDLWEKAHPNSMKCTSGSDDSAGRSITETTSEITPKTTTERLFSFDGIWKLYPDKKGRVRAFTAYKKAIKDGVAHECIELGLSRYMEYVSKQRKHGFKELKWQNGGTWFHNRGWEDEYECQGHERVRFE